MIYQITMFKTKKSIELFNVLPQKLKWNQVLTNKLLMKDYVMNIGAHKARYGDGSRYILAVTWVDKNQLLYILLNTACYDEILHVNWNLKIIYLVSHVFLFLNPPNEKS